MKNLYPDNNNLKLKKVIGAVIGASDESIHAITTARKMGIYVIAIDGDRYAPGFMYADKQYVVDIKEHDTLVNIFGKEQVSFVIPVPIGRYLSSIGYINTYFKLPGISMEASDLCTDKLLFHEKLFTEGLRSAVLFVLKEENKDKILHMTLPVIIKPRFGSGSHGVVLIKTYEELKKHYEMVIKQKEDYICETAVEGIEYGLDGVIIEGKCKIVLLRSKINTKPPMRQCLGYYTIPLNDNLYSKVELYMNKVINVLKMDNCIVHADIIIDKENIFVIEISGRPSGHNIHDVFVPLATGVDIIEEFLNYLLNRKYNFHSTYIKNMALYFFDFENCIIDKIPILDKLRKKNNIVQYQCNIKEGDYLGTIQDDAVLKRGYFIVQGRDNNDLLNQYKNILNSFEVRML